jgi:hypothetical protein
MGRRATIIGRLSLGRRRVRCAIVAAGTVMAGIAAADSVRAQSSGLFDPTPEADARNLPSFSGSGPPGPPPGFRRVLTDGNPPPSGAGSTGFVSKTSRPALQETPLPLAEVDAASAEPSVASIPQDAGADDFVTPPARPRRKRAAEDDPYAPLGLRAGSFLVKPAIELWGGFDTNPERVNTPRGGNVLMVVPELQIRSDWSRHELNADVRGRYTTYPGFTAVPTLNQPFVDAKIAGRIDVTRRTRIDLEARFLLSTENPNSPDLPAGIARLPITTTVGATAGVAQTFNRLELGVSGSFDRITYGNSTLTSGVIVSNADRNYDQTGVKLRGSYEITPGIKPFVEVNLDRRVYDLPVDASGVDRDSTGNEVRVGTSFELTRQLNGSAAIGYATRRYQDPALENLRGLIADGSLVWTATPLTKVTFTARSRVDESTLAGVSGVLRRDFGAQVDHSLRRWLIGTVKFEYGLDDYVGSPRVDERYTLSGLLTYKLSREMQLKGEIRRQWLTSNVPSADYTANIFLVGLRLQR